jgi:spermidine/putrescine transport system permease protein
VRRRGRFLGIYTFVVIGYLFIPVIVMALFGFNDIQGRFNFAWQGFTFEHYRTLFEIPELTDALKNSMVIAVVSTFFATVLGTLIALALTRYNFRGRGPMNLFIFLPMATPEIVMGVSLLTLFVTLQVPRGLLTIVIAHIMFSISYVVVTVRARIAGFDLSLEDAAEDLGATPWTVFWTVTFPLIFPGILAAGLLVFALSFDDYVITLFNAGGTTWFAGWVYGASRIGVPPQVNVMGTLIFGFGVLYVIGSIIFIRNDETKKRVVETEATVIPVQARITGTAAGP